MKYLLDTVIWLWSVSEPERISKRGNGVLSDGDSKIYFSAASSWELAIKVKIGKYRLPHALAVFVPSRLAAMGVRSLSITQLHALATEALPLHHTDPFDRLLIAQAIAEDMTILTADRAFENYGVNILWCGK
jgi:PIN domain nuclease of toxin-antitoxin system